MTPETAQWKTQYALGIVQAAGGYPFEYNKGDIITGLNEAERNGSKVFHAGTKEKGGDIITAGGRVLCTVALGNTVAEAQNKAYASVNKINWSNVYFRTDIGYRAVERENS